MPLYAFSISVTLEQGVLLERDTKISASAATWSTGTAGGGESLLREFIRGSVADHVDRFINAYLAANPKQ